MHLAITDAIDYLTHRDVIAASCVWTPLILRRTNALSITQMARTPPHQLHAPSRNQVELRVDYDAF